MNKNLGNIYIGAWCLYFLQGTLYESGTRLSQILMLLLIASSIYYFVYANRKYKLPKVLKSLNILVYFFTIYGLINIIFGNQVRYVADYIYLKAIYMSLLPIYPFYVFTRKGFITEKTIKAWLFIFIPVAIATFYRLQREMLIAAMEIKSSQEEFTNNAGYIVLSIVPLIILWKKRPLIQYIMLAICVLYILLGMKRGAMLIGAVCVLYFINKSFNKQSSTKKVFIFFAVIALFVVAFYATEQMINTSEYFNVRLQQTREGSSSGRDLLYLQYFNYFITETNLFTFLIGSGADATLRMGEYAHNDWLEIMVNNGLVGFGLYFYYWYLMYKTYRHTKDDTCRSLIGLFFIIYFLRTFFSMSYNDISMYSALALGYALAKSSMLANLSKQEERQQKRIKV